MGRGERGDLGFRGITGLCDRDGFQRMEKRKPLFSRRHSECGLKDIDCTMGNQSTEAIDFPFSPS